MPPRTRTTEEIGEDLDEIKAALALLSERLDQRFVPRELYEARHQSLRDEVAREIAVLNAKVEAGDAATGKTAESARTLSVWALGVLASAVVIALVGFLLNGAGGAT
jgi:hypothetical protein